MYEPCYFVLTIMTQPQLYRFGQWMVDLPIGISVVSACGIVVISVRFIKSIDGIIESSKLRSHVRITDCLSFSAASISSRAALLFASVMVSLSVAGLSTITGSQ